VKSSLYEAQRAHTLATTGPHAYVRHPQYVGFVLIMLGFLFQWPTLVTLIMFPILVTMYARLARREEQEVLAEFGMEYRRYMESKPACFPRFGRGMREKSA
jgi:protein-S-isoprenylcysteine O-methyltransferase Ste14